MSTINKRNYWELYGYNSVQLNFKSKEVIIWVGNWREGGQLDNQSFEKFIKDGYEKFSKEFARYIILPSKEVETIYQEACAAIQSSQSSPGVINQSL